MNIIFSETDVVLVSDAKLDRQVKVSHIARYDSETQILSVMQSCQVRPLNGQWNTGDIRFAIKKHHAVEADIPSEAKAIRRAIEIVNDYEARCRALLADTAEKAAPQ